ncbi:hypothetical protein M527_17075 [Sphingobium indicum IP26]|nr:hypothetical protein M527_17075 [Sphingobium indicum IP26]EQA99425.1 hypothetical protein L286_19475 [Sphingobium sp. HDIP04]
MQEFSSLNDLKSTEQFNQYSIQIDLYSAGFDYGINLLLKIIHLNA